MGWDRFICLVAAAFMAATTGTAGLARAPSTCDLAGGGKDLDIGRGVSIHYRTIGYGRPVLLLPSLGRSAQDFEIVAKRMARKGWMSILADPRGVGLSKGPAPETLFDIADDFGALVSQICRGPVDVVGHAYGNRIARALATRYPGRVGRLALLAGGGEVPLTPELKAALKSAFTPKGKPASQRLSDIRLAFFAEGNDPSVWVGGWFSEAAEQQIRASDALPVSAWWNGGRAPIMLVQALEDPIAPPGNAKKLSTDIGERLTLVNLPHASHAMLPEQPRAIAELLDAYFAKHRAAPALQIIADKLSVRK